MDRCEEGDAQDGGRAEKMGGRMYRRKRAEVEREVIPRIEARIRKPTTVTRGLSWSSTAQPTTSWGTSQEGQAVSSSSFGASLVSDVVAADVSVS